MTVVESMVVKGRDSSSSNNNNNIESKEDMDLRRGPWTVDEDLALTNYIANHGEGRWNSLAPLAGLKRTGKSCRLRWLNYLHPDVRLGNITLEEQLLILELHNRWGNRWSKIAQCLPGRTDNEIKNYWRTRVQKHAKQLKCDMNSKQFKDTIRYLWMPRLVERIQASAPTTFKMSSPTLCTCTNVTTSNIYDNNLNNSEVHKGKMVLPQNGVMNDDFVGSHITTSTSQSYTPENSSTGASSDTFGTHEVSPILDLSIDYYSVPVSSNNNPNPQDYFQPSQFNYSDCITSPSWFNFQAMEPNSPWIQSGDTLNNFWNVDSNMFLQQQLMSDNM
ncbi:hypothetical protein TanjilG_29157 [Lupinus angustifolius]|uniref:Uncharacterized protein n=1 Tax=Lupinus angustifolius TaxID=3871 RepID=A0A1J7GI84_LUPAN|nr:PREDICTED: transcription factor MYB108-like [Lupinus angustifolius]OIW00167.1 hypothetical protein TanjilG_29157 [Lupinus angustifolius]